MTQLVGSSILVNVFECNPRIMLSAACSRSQCQEMCFLVLQVRNANPPIQVTGRHVSVTEAMKEYCRRRLACLHLDYPKIIEVQILLDVQKYRHMAEVILHCSNHITLEASAESDDMYVSVDEVVDKIARQM